MSDFAVCDVAFPPEAKQRVIVNTDAKVERFLPALGQCDARRKQS
jgi:hypothetical protein